MFPDSAPILRANLDTRKVDTIISYKIHLGAVYAPAIGDDGKPSIAQLQQVISTVDDWGVLSDGSIAIVRGHDYHVDILQSDGTRLSGPKLPFDFKRFTNEDKQKMIDSARAAVEQRRAELRAANGTVNFCTTSSTTVAFSSIACVCLLDVLLPDSGLTELCF